MWQTRVAVVDFPWLPLTTLQSTYTDHHLLYHALLIPFILVFGPLLGMKIATAAFATTVFLLFFFFLRFLRIPYATFLTFLLLFTWGFAFRMSLSKTPSLVCILMIAIFWLMLRRRWIWLGILNFLFVWTHAGFFLAILMTLIFSLAQFISHIFQQQRHDWRGLLRCFAPVFSSSTGIFFGILLHPSFPQNLRFYWQQVFHIAFVNYHDRIDVGGEWYAPGFLEFISHTSLPLILFFAALLIFFYRIKRQNVRSWTLFCLSLIFFFFSLKARRYSEIFIPWALVFSGLIFSTSGFFNASTAFFMRLFSSVTAWRRLFLYFFCIAFAFLLGGIMFMSAFKQYQALRIRQYAFSGYQGVGQWLIGHSKPGDRVFNEDWTDFPPLFYHTRSNAFVSGLDPTFFYLQDPALYQKYVDIVRGQEKERLFETLKEYFSVRFVAVDAHSSVLSSLLNQDTRFKVVYQDANMILYELRE